MMDFAMCFWMPNARNYLEGELLRTQTCWRGEVTYVPPLGSPRGVG